MSNADRWLQENGGEVHPACAFEAIGQVIVGRVIDTPRIIETTMDGRTTENYVVAVEVLTGTSIPAGKAGERRAAQVGEKVSIWIKPGNMAAALRTAVSRAGANGVAIGGTLAVKYAGDGERSPGKSPPKLYSAKYEAPAVSVPVPDDLASNIQPNSAVPAAPPSDELF